MKKKKGQSLKNPFQPHDSLLSFLVSAKTNKKLKQHFWYWQASWKLWAGQQVEAGTREQPQRHFWGDCPSPAGTRPMAQL